MTIRKDVYQQLSGDQHTAAIYGTSRGREIRAGLAKRPSLPLSEVQALMTELAQLVSAAATADQQAALDAGLFWQEPPASQWPSTAFKGESFAKIMKTAMGKTK